MMGEEKARKVLDNLVRDIAVSTKRSEALSQLTNKELAEKLISDVWGISKLFGEKSDLLTEAIERLFVLDTPERVYCTADGDYPRQGQDVEWSAGLDPTDFTGVFVGFFENNTTRWKSMSNTYDYHMDTCIFWKPLPQPPKDGE